MKRIILAIALCLVSTGAFAQCNGAFQPNTFCGNNTSATRPPFQISGVTSVFGPTSSTSGDIVIFNNTTGNALADSGHAFGTSGATVPILNANNFFTGITSFGTVNIVSSFVWHGTTYTFPTNGTSLAALQGANTWTSSNTFTGPLTIGVSLFTLPVSPINGGTGNTSLTSNALIVGQGTAPTSSVGPGTVGQYLGSGPAFANGPWTLLSVLTPITSTFTDTTHITSAYNDYQLVFENLTTNSTTNSCTVQFQINGAFQTSGYAAQYVSTVGAGSSSAAVTTGIPCAQSTGFASGIFGIYGSLDIHQPTSNVVKGAIGSIVYNSTTPGTGVATIGGFYTGAASPSAVTGIQVTLATSVWTGGTVRLYGRN